MIGGSHKKQAIRRYMGILEDVWDILSMVLKCIGKGVDHGHQQGNLTERASSFYKYILNKQFNKFKLYKKQKIYPTAL